MNSVSDRAELDRRKTSALAFGVGGAHGDEVGSSATGRGTAKALVWIGAGNGAAVGRPDRLPVDGFFKTSADDFRSGAGQDADETDEGGRGASVFATGAR